MIYCATNGLSHTFNQIIDWARSISKHNGQKDSKMSKKNASRPKSTSKNKTETRARRRKTNARRRDFDSRHTLGPVSTLLLRALVSRPLTLEQLYAVRANSRRSLRGLVDRGLVVEQVGKDGVVRFALSAETARSFKDTLRQARAAGNLGLVLTGVKSRDLRRSGRTRTFKK